MDVNKKQNPKIETLITQVNMVKSTRYRTPTINQKKLVSIEKAKVSPYALRISILFHNRGLKSNELQKNKAYERNKSCIRQSTRVNNLTNILYSRIQNIRKTSGKLDAKYRKDNSFEKFETIEEVHMLHVKFYQRAKAMLKKISNLGEGYMKQTIESTSD